MMRVSLLRTGRRPDFVERAEAGLAAALLLSAAFLLSGCGKPPPPPPAPEIDARQESLVAEALSRPERPTRVIFRWSAQEPGFRASGDGVVRMEPPYKARLDLFMGNGEGVGRAALVRDELRLPPEAVEVPLPPPALFWATLGVFRPGPGSALLGASAEDGGTLLRYGFVDGHRLHYLMNGRRIRRVELLRDGNVEEEVRLDWEGAEGRVPAQARYRDMRATRELNLTLEGIEDVESYPPDIWTPGG